MMVIDSRSAHGKSAKAVAGAIICAVFLLAPRYFLQEKIGGFVVKHDAGIWFAGIVLTGLALHILVPRHANSTLLGITLAWLAVGVGIGNLAVIGIWGASACALGGFILAAVYRDRRYALNYLLEAAVVGVAAWLAIWGSMLHFEINYRGIYWGLCFLPFVGLPFLATGELPQAIRSRQALLIHWIRSIPLFMWVPGIAVVGWVLRWSVLPSVMYDDHALHLRMWTTLTYQHRAEFNPVDQIWSVSPFAADLLHAALSLMANEDIRGAWNLVLALTIMGLTARILHLLVVRSRWQWVLLVLLASTPMFGNLLLSLQTELALGVMPLMAVALIGDAERAPTNHIFGVLACAAVCTAIKLPGAVLGVLCIVALLANGNLQKLRPRSWFNLPGWLTLVVLAFVAIHAYGIAAYLTGNPFFPLYNRIFQSPFFPDVNFSDSTWSRGFSLSSYIDAFFETSRYFESSNYAAGWQYLFILPLALLISVFRNTPRLLRVSIIPLVGFGLIMFAAVQYWRYLFPVMPLAVVSMGVLFSEKRGNAQTFYFTLAIACIGLNLVFYRNISGLMQVPAQTYFTVKERNSMVRAFAPAVALTQTVNSTAPGARVLYPFSTPSGAILHGSPLYTTWYATARSLRFQGIKDSLEAGIFIRNERALFVIISNVDSGPTRIQSGFIREYVARHGRLVDQAGSFMLYDMSSNLGPVK